MKLISRLVFLTALTLVSCNVLVSPETETILETPTQAVTNVAVVPADTRIPATDVPQAEHVIGIRQVNGVGEFYNKATHEKFVPRGANYVFVPFGNSYTNLTLKVGVYDSKRTREDFVKLVGLGYNTVRVFLDSCNAGPECIGDSDNVGLNPEYLDNIADMMSAGRETGVYIQFTSNDLPDQGGYSDEANSASSPTFAGYRNSYYPDVKV
jgi:hypothetical protein